MEQLNNEKFSFSQSIYYEIGKLKRILNVRVIENVDLVENYTNYAIRFELKPAKADYAFYANLPSDETEQLLFSMNSIIDKHTKAPPKNYTEFLFSSSEGFITGAFWLKKDKKWLMYIKLANEMESQMVMEIVDYKKLIVLITKASKIFS